MGGPRASHSGPISNGCEAATTHSQSIVTSLHTRSFGTRIKRPLTGAHAPDLCRRTITRRGNIVIPRPNAGPWNVSRTHAAGAGARPPRDIFPCRQPVIAQAAPNTIYNEISICFPETDGAYQGAEQYSRYNRERSKSLLALCPGPCRSIGQRGSWQSQ